MAEDIPKWDDTVEIPPKWEDTKDSASHSILDRLKSYIPHPSPGMEKQFDQFLDQIAATGRNPAEHPNIMAIGGMINNLGAGLKNPEAVANAVQDVTTLGQGRKLSAPINAKINQALWGEGDNALDKEKLRQETLGQDNPYLPFAVGAPISKLQGLVPTDGVIPEYLTKPVSGQLEKLTDLLNKSKAIRALKAVGARGNEVTPSELEGPGGMLEKGKAAFDEGIIGPFASKTTMRNRALDLSKSGGAKMGDILEKSGQYGAEVDPENLISNLQRNIGNFNRSAPSQSNKLAVLNDIIGDTTASAEKNPIKNLMNASVDSASGDESLARLSQDFVLKNKINSLRNEVEKMSELAVTPEQKKAAEFFTNRLEKKITQLKELRDMANLKGTGFNLNDTATMRFGNKIPEDLSPIINAEKNKLDLLQQHNTVPTYEKMLPTAVQDLKGSWDELARWNRAGDLPENAVKASSYRSASNVAREQINDAVSKSLGQEGLNNLNAARLQHGTGEEFSSLLNRAAGQENAGAGGISVEPVTKSLFKPVSRKWNQVVGSAQHAASDVTGGLANIVKNSPESLGHFAPDLQQAASRGPAALASTNFILNQRDPEYREKIRQINGQ